MLPKTLHFGTKQGWAPLHSAANWGNYEVIGRLISHGVDVNARSNGSVTKSGEICENQQLKNGMKLNKPVLRPEVPQKI
ncbi:ankyrin repeat protein [Teladorsagia circumcincta]|uniref:Ankyrin repeat protein n=1 Tax=Teladorsagia circumcincta TaxID=45464 RepID=A0A2G9U312_TELCI|nr:ankyrin repeat protein [Teladorsagia circumcincta]